MSTETANAYLRTKVMSASPAELRLLLIDGAIKFSRQGRDGIASADFEAAYNGLSQAKAILLELINCLRPEVDPELCSKLSGLYTFMYRRLLDAGLEKDAAVVDEVLTLLEYERETWSMLMEKLGADGVAADAAATPEGDTPATPMHDDEPAARAPLSIEG